MPKVRVLAVRRDKGWVQTLLTGFEDKLDEGDLVLIEDGTVRVDKNRKTHYNPNTPGEGAGGSSNPPPEAP